MFPETGLKSPRFIRRAAMLPSSRSTRSNAGEGCILEHGDDCAFGLHLFDLLADTLIFIGFTWMDYCCSARAGVATRRSC